MTRRLFIVLALTLMSSLGGAHAQSGVLLGLRVVEPIPKPLPYYHTAGDSLGRAVYRTVLITNDGSRVRMMGEADELVIPRTQQFWHVGTKRSAYNDWVEDFVWAAPAGQPPSLVGISPFNGEYCQGHRAQDILYAGPSYLAIEQRTAGYCEGAAHPWFFNTLAVVPLDSTTHTGLDIADVLGPEASAALATASEGYLSSLSEVQRAAFVQEPDAANWALVRRDGQWRIVGRIDNADLASQGLFADLLLDYPVPARLLGRRQSTFPWPRVLAAVPQAVDALVAPEVDWVLILRPTRLTVHALNGSTIGPVLYSLPVRSGTQVVMARWASGERLRMWTEQFRSRAQSPLAPQGGR